MAARKDLTDRNGKSQEMVKRSFRLTDEENAMLNHLIAQTGLTLRDLMAQLVEEKYNTWDWNFGHSPKYSLYNELKYPGGNVEFNLNVEGGIIKDIKFFGDFFGKCDISHIENLLLNTKHEEESLKTILNSININDYFLGADTDVLVSGIMGVK